MIPTISPIVFKPKNSFYPREVVIEVQSQHYSLPMFKYTLQNNLSMARTVKKQSNGNPMFTQLGINIGASFKRGDTLLIYQQNRIIKLTIPEDCIINANRVQGRADCNIQSLSYQATEA